VIPANDGGALTAKIQLLVQDTELARRMGRQGRLKVEREFDAARNVPKILAAMKELVDRGRAQNAAT